MLLNRINICAKFFSHQREGPVVLLLLVGGDTVFWYTDTILTHMSIVGREQYTKVTSDTGDDDMVYV